MRGEVLVRAEPRGEGSKVGHVTIERGHRLPQSQVAGRPGVRPREVAREEPVDRPFADSGQRREPSSHFVVRQPAKRAEVEGYYVGGKTGTSEKVVNGRYAKDKLLTAFREWKRS